MICIVQGTLDQFDYPKKGKNIPPSKHDAPPKEIVEDQEEGEAQSYYDEDGNRVEGEVLEGEQEGYGEEQQQYGEE